MDLAIEAMHKALELLLNDKDIHFDLAEYYAKTADTVNALKFYASGLEWYMEEEKEDDYFKAEAIVRKGSLISD